MWLTFAFFEENTIDAAYFYEMHEHESYLTSLVRWNCGFDVRNFPTRLKLTANEIEEYDSNGHIW